MDHSAQEPIFRLDLEYLLLLLLQIKSSKFRSGDVSLVLGVLLSWELLSWVFTGWEVGIPVLSVSESD
jgi:hypothetical protein